MGAPPTEAESAQAAGVEEFDSAAGSEVSLDCSAAGLAPQTPAGAKEEGVVLLVSAGVAEEACFEASPLM